MPFFPPQAFLSSQADLLQLLSELEQPQPKACAPRHCRRQAPQPSFTPRFDVTEVPQAYELYGELPGIEQKDLVIEFSDAQTLVIKGKTERNAPTVAQPEPEAAKEADTVSEKSSHSATVEDEYDEADTPLATPATAAAETAAPAPEKAAEPQTPKPKYWVAERKVGEFARSFSFSQRIEQDEVRAELKNGILRVVVPKSQRTARVAVSVL